MAQTNPGQELTKVPDQIVALAGESLTESQLRLLIDTIGKGLTVEEFQLFVASANTLGLNPLVKEIESIRFQKDQPPSVYVGVAGRLRKAHESKDLDYIKGPLFTADGKEWLEVWLDPKNPPAAAKVLIKRKGWSEPLTAICTWSSWSRHYFNKQQGKRVLMPKWQESPDHMLGNAALRLGLRRAFALTERGEVQGDPGDIYEDEPISPEQLKALQTVCNLLGYTDRGERLSAVSEIVGREVDSFKNLTSGEASNAYEELAAMLDAFGMIEEAEVVEEPAEVSINDHDAGGPVEDAPVDAEEANVVEPEQEELTTGWSEPAEESASKVNSLPVTDQDADAGDEKGSDATSPSPTEDPEDPPLPMLNGLPADIRVRILEVFPESRRRLAEAFIKGYVKKRGVESSDQLTRKQAEELATVAESVRPQE